MSQLTSRRWVLGAAASIVFPFCRPAKAAEPLNAGRFAAFIPAGRIDIEIAHVLTVLDGYPANSWARETAEFAYTEMKSDKLLALLKASSEPRLRQALLSFPDHDLDINSALALARNPGVKAATTPVNVRDRLCSVVLVRDDIVRNGTQKGSGRKLFAQVLAHELTHARNHPNDRNVLGGPLGLALKVATAGSDADFRESMRSYLTELAASHVAWRVALDIEAKWDGKVLREPKAPSLWNFCYDMAVHVPTMSGKYIRELMFSSPRELFPLQVARWVEYFAANYQLHSDGARDLLARAHFTAAVLAAAPNRYLPIDRIPADGGISAWNH
jgi:hypothetical protein